MMMCSGVPDSLKSRGYSTVLIFRKAWLPEVFIAGELRMVDVPVAGTLNGMDALLSIAQMPKGVPVACVGVDNGDNAAWLAVRILKLAG